MRNKILIYKDYGCADVSNLFEELKEYFEPLNCKIEYTDSTDIIKYNSLNNDVLAFFMPGGRGTPYRQKLQVLGNDKIRDYVLNGGIYYGICAGAYYACSQTVFEKDIPQLRIISKCGLDLINGKAIGTLYKELNILPYDKTAASSTVVNVIWNTGEKYTAHYHGGSYFELNNPSENEVLAIYEIEGDKPAIVSRKYGKGLVVVSGVHYENSGEVLAKAIHDKRIDFKYAKQVADKLRSKENLRKALFNKIMALSGR